MELIILAAGVFVLLAVTSIVVIIVLSKKKSKNKADGFRVVQEMNNFVDDEVNKTTVMNARNDDTRTMGIWSGSSAQRTLYLTDVRNPARMFRAALNGKVVIGRARGEADMVIDCDVSISGRHCMISEKMGRFYIQDLQSMNGTLLNGRQVTSEVEVYSGSLVTIGNLEMKLDIR